MEKSIQDKISTLQKKLSDKENERDQFAKEIRTLTHIEDFELHKDLVLAQTNSSVPIKYRKWENLNVEIDRLPEELVSLFFEALTLSGSETLASSNKLERFTKDYTI